ncbi:MAG: sensor histidine kinase, partial [Spirochaetales bacterium]|nr:sensor histidine kinase [Spirochaetales bacterium]
ETKYFQVPKLILQPLVENAVLHGIEPLERPGTLTVKAIERNTTNEQGLLIEIMDNGQGFDSEEIEKKSNIGIGNVTERLRINWPQSSFTIDSHIGEGTKVVIEI